MHGIDLSHESWRNSRGLLLNHRSDRPAEEGLRASLNAFVGMVAAIALYCAKLVRFEDLFEDLIRRLTSEEIGNQSTSL
jgi:hypothetical protein